MKKLTKALLAAAAVLSFAGCANSGASTAALSDPTAMEQEFAANGFEVRDVKTTAAGETVFKAVGANGGANVRVDQYESAEQAKDAYDTLKASLTQSMYYILNEKTFADGGIATFNNSINYVDAIAAYDEKTNTVIEASEISQDNLDTILTALEAYGIVLQ